VTCSKRHIDDEPVCPKKHIQMAKCDSRTKTKFGIVVGLNVLELIEPLDFLNVVSSQVRGTVVISDPYDFERGKESVKQRINSKSLRAELIKLGFTLMQNTTRPSFLPWKLNINSRLSLHYKVDLIIAKNATT